MIVLLIIIILVLAFMSSDNIKYGGNELTYYTKPSLLLTPSNIETDITAEANKFKELYPDATFIGATIEHLNTVKNPEYIFFAEVNNGIYSLHRSVTKLINDFDSNAIDMYNMMTTAISKAKKYKVLVYLPVNEYFTLPSGEYSIPEHGSLNKPCVFISGPSDNIYKIPDLRDKLFNYYKLENNNAYADNITQLNNEMVIADNYSPVITSASPRLPLFDYNFKNQSNIFESDYILACIFINSYNLKAIVCEPDLSKRLKNKYPNISFTDKPTGEFGLICNDVKMIDEMKPTYASLKWKIPDGDGLTEMYSGVIYSRPFDYSGDIQLFIGDINVMKQYDKTLIREQIFRNNVVCKDRGHLNNFIKNLISDTK